MTKDHFETHPRIKVSETGSFGPGVYLTIVNDYFRSFFLSLSLYAHCFSPTSTSSHQKKIAYKCFSILKLLNQRRLEMLKEKWWNQNPNRKVCGCVYLFKEDSFVLLGLPGG